MRCGEVYCERCGDCIYCYGDDPCCDGGPHSYIDSEGEEQWDVSPVDEDSTLSVKPDANPVILQKNKNSEN